MSERYVNDRYLPDKAIDAIDEAAARTGLTKYLPSPKLRFLEEEQIALEKEKENAVFDQDFERAGQIKRKQEAGRLEIEKLQARNGKRAGRSFAGSNRSRSCRCDC